MASLSNSIHAGDAVEARPAAPNEVHAAVSILLAGAQGRATDEQIQSFIAMSSQRGLPLNDLWIAVQGRQIVWAMMPVVSPGRTMLLLSPPFLPKNLPAAPIAAVIKATCAFYQKHGVQLAQLLIDPAETSLRKAYVDQGFLDLAELIYLQREVKRVVATVPLPPTLSLTPYSPQQHPLFVQTIARSYEQSLDCPGLSGLRDMEDVVEGHKGAGQFDPNLWFLLSENDVPRGVLLLGAAAHADALELIYLGLIPEARGRGFGELLMNVALLSVVRQNRAELTLAVDSRNVPAMRLYFRHGLRRIGSRAALIRRLGD